MCSDGDLKAFPEAERALARPYEVDPGELKTVAWQSARLTLAKSVHAVGEPLAIELECGDEVVDAVAIVTLDGRELARSGAGEPTLTAPTRPGWYLLELHAGAFVPVDMPFEVVVPAQHGGLRCETIERDPSRVPVGATVTISWQDIPSYCLYPGAYVALVRRGEDEAGGLVDAQEQAVQLPTDATTLAIAMPMDPGCFELRLYDRAWNDAPYRIASLRFHLVVPRYEDLLRAPDRVAVGTKLAVEVAAPTGVSFGWNAHIAVDADPNPSGARVDYVARVATYTIAGNGVLEISDGWLTEPGTYVLRLYDRHNGWCIGERTIAVEHGPVPGALKVASKTRVGAPLAVHVEVPDGTYLRHDAELVVQLPREIENSELPWQGAVASYRVPAERRLELRDGWLTNPGRYELVLHDRRGGWEIARTTVEVVTARQPGCLRVPPRIDVGQPFDIELVLPPDVWVDRPDVHVIDHPAPAHAETAWYRLVARYQMANDSRRIHVEGGDWLVTPGRYRVQVHDRDGGWLLDEVDTEVVVRTAPGALVAPSQVPRGGALDVAVELPAQLWTHRPHIVVSIDPDHPFADVPILSTVQTYDLRDRRQLALTGDWLQTDGRYRLELFDRPGGWLLANTTVTIGTPVLEAENSATGIGVDPIADLFVGDKVRVTGAWSAFADEPKKLGLYFVASASPPRRITEVWMPQGANVDGRAVELVTLDTPGVYEVRAGDQQSPRWVGRFTVRVPRPAAAIAHVADVELGQNIVVEGNWNDVHLFSGGTLWLYRIDVDPAGTEHLVHLGRATPNGTINFGAAHSTGVHEVQLVDRYNGGFLLWRQRFTVTIPAPPDVLRVENVAIGRSIPVSGSWQALHRYSNGTLQLYRIVRDADRNERREYIAQAHPDRDFEFGGQSWPGTYELVFHNGWNHGFELWRRRFEIVVPPAPSVIEPVANRTLGEPITVTGRWAELVRYSGGTLVLYRVARDAAEHELLLHVAQAHPHADPITFAGQHWPGTYELRMLDRWNSGFVLWSQRFEITAGPAPDGSIDEVEDLQIGDAVRVTGRWNDIYRPNHGLVTLSRVVTDPSGNEQIMSLHGAHPFGDAPTLELGTVREPGTYELVLLDRWSDGFRLWSTRFEARMPEDQQPLAATDAEEPVPHRARKKAITATIAERNRAVRPLLEVWRARSWVRGGASRDEARLEHHAVDGSLSITTALAATAERYLARLVGGSRRLVSDLDLGLVEAPPVELENPVDVPGPVQQIVSLTVVPAELADESDPETWLEDVLTLQRGRRYQVLVRYALPLDGALPDREATIEIAGDTLRLPLHLAPGEIDAALSDPFEVA